jgi:cyanate permease
MKTAKASFDRDDPIVMLERLASQPHGVPRIATAIGWLLVAGLAMLSILSGVAAHVVSRTLALWFVTGVVFPIGMAIVVLRHRTLKVVRTDVASAFVVGVLGLLFAPLASWPVALVVGWLVATTVTGALAYSLFRRASPGRRRLPG